MLWKKTENYEKPVCRENKFLLLFASLLLISVCIFTTGCGEAENNQKEGELVIYTSVYPVYDFTSKLAGEYAQVVNIVPAGVEPHEFELSTQDMVKLAEADLLVYCGAGMENWIDKTLETLGDGKLTAVEASKGIALLTEEDTCDPHVWLAPENAVIMMENITDALCGLDSAHEDSYRKNFEMYKDKLEKLDSDYEEALSGMAGREIVVSHASFGYLCRAYGLVQIPIDGLMADSEPDPATMGEIINRMKTDGITTVFGEELIDNKVVDTIAAETGARVEILEPIEGLGQERMDAGEDYFSIMEKNLEALKAALQ